MKSALLILLCIFPGTFAFAGENFMPQNDSTEMKKPLNILVAKSLAIKPFTLQAAPAILHPNYYETLGAACKAEFKIEKATRIPLRLRLGSLQQTDYLEQKPHALKPERQ